MRELKGENLRKAILFSQMNGYIRCETCFRNCPMYPGKTGFCRTRVHDGEKIISMIYGIISKMSIDKIEEKPFRHFRQGTKCLSFGTYGCNFRCKSCQNFEVSWGTNELDKISEGKIADSIFVPPDIVAQVAKELSCDGIAFTFNEPAIWLEYVVDTARIAKKRGLYTVYVSNSTPTIESIDYFAPFIDAIATDIKSTDDTFYQEICGTAVPVVEKVLGAIRYAYDKGIHIETRTNIIPGYNDKAEVIGKIVEWIKNNLGPDSPYHITTFHPTAKMNNVIVTPKSTLKMAYRIAKEGGLQNVYIQNKPCDCAREDISERIMKVLEKYQRNGVILNDSMLSRNPKSCPCCH